MRYGLLASMLVSLLMAPSAVAQGRSHQRQIKEWFIQKPSAFQEKTWIIQSDKKISKEDALVDALREAQFKVREFLLEQNPPVTWIPEISFIRRELVKDFDVPKNGEIFKNIEPEICQFSINGHRAIEETWKKVDPDITEFHRVSLNVTITPEGWGKILEEQRNDLLRLRNSVMKDRMLFLLKIMVGMVALLATVAGYIRLDEWSKGYYTNWLRLAAMSCIAVAGWWLLLAFK